MSTRDNLTDAHRLAAAVCGEIALLLERGRDLTPIRLKLMTERLREAANILEKVIR